MRFFPAGEPNRAGGVRTTQGRTRGGARLLRLSPFLLSAFLLSAFLAGCGQKDPQLIGPGTPQTGAIAVVSSVAGAAIALDGVPTGHTTPDTLTSVVPGMHGVVVSLAGYVPLPDSATVTVTAGDTARASFGLSPYEFVRVVLVEHFSNWRCIPCTYADPKLDSLMEELGPAPGAEQAIRIAYHDNISSQDDPFYLANPEDASARTDYYNVLSMPSVWLCGKRFDPAPIGWSSSAVYRVLRDSVLARSNANAPLAIGVTHTIGAGAFQAHADITTQDGFRPRGWRLRFVVVEREIIPASPGPLGQTRYAYIMRKMMPDATGQMLVMNPGETRGFDQQVALDAAWNPAELGAVVFVQRDDATREVLQAGSSFFE